jgi:hypothetical protein
MLDMTLIDLGTSRTYLSLNCASFIVTIGAHGQSSNPNLPITALDASSFGKIFLSLLLTNFNLLFFSATAELIWFEGILRFELRAAMLWDVALGHCGQQSPSQGRAESEEEL